jgi:hypothetical protein
MVAVRSFLNSFWRHASEGLSWFDPTRDTAYPDRIRRREPGSPSLGLSPHSDNGSIERWLLPEYQEVFRHVFAGRWRDYDPWDAAHRTEVHEFPSTVMCSAFRTFQGWTALSEMRPGDGVLHVVPIPSAMAFVLLRALQDDVADDDQRLRLRPEVLQRWLRRRQRSPAPIRTCYSCGWPQQVIESSQNSFHADGTLHRLGAVVVQASLWHSDDACRRGLKQEWSFAQSRPSSKQPKHPVRLPRLYAGVRHLRGGEVRPRAKETASPVWASTRYKPSCPFLSALLT